jgi:hypothetical protein
MYYPPRVQIDKYLRQMLQGMRSALREIIAKIGSKSELFRV